MSEEASVEDQLMSNEQAPASEGEAGSNQEAGDGDEEVYEIEEIKEARRNMFGKSRTGYLVKWKGYGDKENSWVDERDADGARELIRDYWKTRQKVPGSGSKEKVTRGRPRRSEGGSSTRTVPSKRVLNVDTESEDETDHNTNKKSNVNGSTTADSKSGPPVLAQNVAILANKKSWEKDIVEIETVEKDPSGMLTVYFQLANGQRVKEEHRLARQRFPQKLLDFYEQSMAWRDEDGKLVGIYKDLLENKMQSDE